MESEARSYDDHRRPPSESVDPVDFYNTFGIHAADPVGSDVFMIRTDHGLLLKVITEKGGKLLEGIKVLEDGSAEEAGIFDATVAKGARTEDVLS